MNILDKEWLEFQQQCIPNVKSKNLIDILHGVFVAGYSAGAAYVSQSIVKCNDREEMIHHIQKLMEALSDYQAEVQVKILIEQAKRSDL